MRILFSHPNYPAQFRRLIHFLVNADHDIVFLAKQQEWHALPNDNIKLIKYTPHRPTSGAFLHPYLRRFESSVIEGQSAYRRALELKRSGWSPDVIVNHVGFGNGLFLKDLFPSAFQISHFEWFYNPYGSDVDFLPPHEVSEDHKLQLRIWNSQTLLELASCDKAVVPTHWQLQQFPSKLRSHFNVIHEGVDYGKLSSLRECRQPFAFLDDFNSDTQILTYVSRCFEEYRGFPQVLKAISKLQCEHPNLHCFIAGQDGTAYGTPRQDGITWSEWARRDLALDPKRTHWLGSIQEDQYYNLLSWSDVHIYLTVPFILSWSLIEAMAAKCAIVASDTPPVQEILQNGESALLVDFFDGDALVTSVSRILDDRTLANELSSNASLAASNYDSSFSGHLWAKLLSVH